MWKNARYFSRSLFRQFPVTDSLSTPSGFKFSLPTGFELRSHSYDLNQVGHIPTPSSDRASDHASVSVPSLTRLRLSSAPTLHQVKWQWLKGDVIVMRIGSTSSYVNMRDRDTMVYAKVLFFCFTREAMPSQILDLLQELAL